MTSKSAKAHKSNLVFYAAKLLLYIIVEILFYGCKNHIWHHRTILVKTYKIKLGISAIFSEQILYVVCARIDLRKEIWVCGLLYFLHFVENYKNTINLPQNELSQSKLTIILNLTAFWCKRLKRLQTFTLIFFFFCRRHKLNLNLCNQFPQNLANKRVYRCAQSINVN